MVANLSALDLVQVAKMTFTWFELPRKIVSDAEQTYHQKFSRNCAECYASNNPCIILSLPQQWSSRSMLQICKTHNQKYTDTNQDTNLALLQIQATPVGAGLPRPAIMLFNRPIQGFWSQTNRVPINMDNDDVWYKAPEAHQTKYNKFNDIQKHPYVFSTGYTVMVQGGWELWMHGVIAEPKGVISQLNMGHKDGKAHHMQYKTHTDHRYISRTVPL